MTQYLGLRDWEWMIRTAAQPEPPEDDFSDIWQNARGGRNPYAEDWLNNRVRYERGDRSHQPLHPTNWRGVAEEDLPYGDVQHQEANRSIDDDHDAFRHALQRGLSADPLDEGQFSVGGPQPQEYEPTSPERLASDEGWLLGPNKTFNFPGGHEQAEAMHNGMHQRGFELENEGTDENPSPAYVHKQTGARIRPGVDANTGESNWQMNSPGSGITEHAGQASAAAMHAQGVADRDAAEAARWQSSQSHRDRYPEEYQNYDSRGNRTPRRSREPSGTRRRESPDYIPKTKAQALPWRELFSQAVHGNQGAGREFERASVKSVLNPNRGSTGRLYGVHQDQWDQDFENDRQGRGKVAQAIYHYETPIAWKYHSVQPDGTYDEGTWRRPATSFGSGGFFATGRVQGLMSGAFHGTNHEYLRDPQVSHRLHRAMEEGGIHRQEDQSYRAVDNFGNQHHLAPSQSGQTMVHTVTSPEGRTFTKRVPSLEAAQTASRMMDSPGAGGPTDPADFLRGKNYRDSEPPAPSRRRREVPLRIQPELPGMRNIGSIVDWSESLRGVRGQ